MQANETNNDISNNLKISPDGDSKDHVMREELPQHLLNSIDRIIKEEGFLNYTINKKNISSTGGSYMADLYDVSIKGTTTSGNKELNLFIKCMKSDLKVKMITPAQLNDIEISIYKDYAILCNELQEEVNLPEDERYQFVKCYDVRNSSGVIMENMAKKGYTVPNRGKVPSLEYVQLGIQKIAKFHAMSFVIQKKRPAQYEEIIKMKSPINVNEDCGNFIKHACDATLDVIESDEVRKKLLKLSDGMLDKYRSFIIPKNSNICVLTHGDYRLNNILVLEKGGHTLDLIPVDFQCAFYGNPMNDFFYFLVGITDQQFRKDHWSDLKELYYDTLKNFLGYFEISVESVYPRKTFDSAYKEGLEYGLLASILFTPFFLAPEDDFPDLSKDDLASMKITKSDLYTERLNGLLNDFMGWGCL